MKEDRAEKVLEELMAENFPTLAREVNLQIQKAECVPKMINPLKSMPRHIIMNLLKIKMKKKS